MGVEGVCVSVCVWGMAWSGKRPVAQTPLKQKHPFSSKNKPPSQDLHEWATSAGRGSSNEGQDVPLRTHLRRAEGQKPEYIDPSLSLCHCPALPSHPGRAFSTPLKKIFPSYQPFTELQPVRRRGRAWNHAQQTKTERQRLYLIKEQLRCYERLICSLCDRINRNWGNKISAHCISCCTLKVLFKFSASLVSLSACCTHTMS